MRTCLSLASESRSGIKTGIGWAFAIFSIWSVWVASGGALAHAARGPQLFAPLPGARVAGDEVVVELSDGCPSLSLDGEAVPLRKARVPYRGSLWIRLPLAKAGAHRLEVRWACPGVSPVSRELRFSSAPSVAGAVEVARALIAAMASRHPPEDLRWDWSEAILLHGMERFRRKGLPVDTYLKSYHSAWAKRGVPSVNRSDRCAPALSGLALLREGFEPAREGVEAVADYLRRAKRFGPGVLDHLGTSAYGLLYPPSAWADSLMMYALFAAEAGAYLGDDALRDFGAAQPRLFAELLQDSRTGLFRHASHFWSGRVMPKDAFWLRGNGWVLAATGEILEGLPAGHPERPALLRIFQELSRALMPYQMANGLWDSLLDRPGGVYPETSGSALVAYGWLKGVRHGWLAESYRDPALRALAAVTARTTASASGDLSLTGISGPTNALPAVTYRWVKQKADLGYGVGAFLLAASEAELGADASDQQPLRNAGR